MWKFILIGISCIIFSGCTTSALHVIKSTDEENAIVPDVAIIQKELKNRSFELGKIYMDIRTQHPKEEHVLPDEAYTKMLLHCLERAFSVAEVTEGEKPGCTVNVAIEEMRFTKGRVLIPNPSLFQTRMEIVRPEGVEILRASFKSMDPQRAVPVLIAGILTPISIPGGSPFMAHANLIPAMAVMLTKVLLGLKDGKTLDSIELVSDFFDAPPAGDILRDNQFGMRPLTPIETQQITGFKFEDFLKDE